MKIRHYWIVMLLSVGSQMAIAAESVVNIQTWQTKNGIPVYFVEREELPMVDLAVIFDAGSRRDADKPGTASLTAHVLAQGAADMDADAIANGFESVGAEYDASVGKDYVSFNLRTLTENASLKSSLNIFKTVLTAPSFPGDQFKRLSNQTLMSLKMRKQSAQTQAFDLFFRNLYPNGPYQFPVEGTEEAVPQIALEDVKAFYQKYYVAAAAKIVLVGDIDTVEAKAIANDIASVLPTGKAPAAFKQALAVPEGKNVSETFPGPQTAIVLGQLGIDRKDPHYYALTVGNAILGGLPFNSRLFDIVREKQGLSYAVYSDLSPMQQKGPFAVVLQTQNAKADQAIKLTQDTIMQFLVNGPSESELKLAKQNIEGAFPLVFASNQGILSAVVSLAFYDMPLTYFDEYRDHINEVTQLQIQQAFRQLLTQDHWLLVRVGHA